MADIAGTTDPAAGKPLIAEGIAAGTTDGTIHKKQPLSENNESKMI